MIEPWKLFGRLGNNMFQMAYIYAQMKEGNIPDIYLQDPKYFEKFEKDIKALYGQGLIPSHKVAIHVRRGDYVNNKFYVDLTKTDYYVDAMKEFPGAEFLVFSDDIEWCKGYFIGKEYEFCEERDEIISLNLMAGCKGVIIANSSYSWWAGYLSRGKVVAPKEWYSDKRERTKTPSTWIRI